jgi:hypothetical protein
MLKDLSVRSKLLLGFGTTTLASLVIGFFSIAAMTSMKNRDALLFQTRVQPMDQMARYAMEFQQIRIELGEIAADSSCANCEGHASTIKSHFNVLDSLEQLVGKSLDTDTTKAFPWPRPVFWTMPPDSTCPPPCVRWQASSQAIWPRSCAF